MYNVLPVPWLYTIIDGTHQIAIVGNVLMSDSLSECMHDLLDFGGGRHVDELVSNLHHHASNDRGIGLKHSKKRIVIGDYILPDFSVCVCVCVCRR